MKTISSSILSSLRKIEPFQSLSDPGFTLISENAGLQNYEIGERLCRSDEMPGAIHLILKGEVRLLVESLEGKGLITLDRRSKGQFIGWSGLLRAGACETVQASMDLQTLQIPSETFVRLCRTESGFASFFALRASPQEAWIVGQSLLSNMPRQPEHLDARLKEASQEAIAISWSAEEEIELPNKEFIWYLSTAGCPAQQIGSELEPGQKLNGPDGLILPLRAIGLPKTWLEKDADNLVLPLNNPIADNTPTAPEQLDVGAKDLLQLGILEHENVQDKDRFPSIKGNGVIDEGLAVLQMLSMRLKLTFRKDLAKRYLLEEKKRNKPLTMETLGALCEGMGMQTDIGVLKPEHLSAANYPALEILDGHPRVLWDVKGGEVIISDPKVGLLRERPENRDPESPVQLLLVKKSVSATTERFGWSWFIPLVKKYKWALVLVFAASLLAQLMGLAIPLMLQQIIDKVLNQGNTSTLNVLGGTMVILALFQGLLTGLRQFIFVDTTDRMDLTLGSAVIDRLLGLPLKYFERRPVGELSQRLGELNQIRGFLTGTALISVMNLMFAAMYLVVMFLYSPLLTAIALSTFPIYMVMILIVAPIYKTMIRKRAVAQARTQAHLIEVLTGIQTVKAQNIQLTARWKWQDRYKHFVEQGFRTVTVGVATGQIGGFLTKLSSLLVLWIGMLEILKGNLTLGQLIAFRIISGNVTGPLLQLSTLWQGFQGVQLSMERLGDILNQNSEQTEEESQQIGLPPIEGKISYEKVSFRFGNSGPYQVDEVNVDIPAGSFVGIAGQSGSGKSTLMKLLPRLYKIEKGRVLIDGYDISKIELGSLRRQIGMVPQDSLLFEGTVADNISMNDPTADDTQIIEAASIACAHEFIMELPQGYATSIAERGSNLSGGQRQRIAIARTILSNPSLLVMDEATSALDYETERMVCLNLQKWAENRTVLFITHRLSTIRNADLILLMHQGRLSEQGKHDYLMKLNGRYATLFGQQDAAEGLT